MGGVGGVHPQLIQCRSVVVKYRVNTGLTRLLIKVKGPIFINTGSDVYEYQKYRVWRRYRVESQI
jgi:hypothetical protein